jgi:OmcA/MtrC family decaheme c-type cytochrome
MRKHGRLIANLLFVILTGALTLSIAGSTTTRRRSVSPGDPAKPGYRPDQIESYLSEDTIAYIRPGLKLKVNSITIGTDRKLVVDVSFTDDFDQPVDRLGRSTPGPISASFIIAWWNAEERHYTSYITRTATGVPTSPNPGARAIQAATDSGGVWTDLETGHGKYTFGTALPDGFDQTKTHTLGIYSSRNLTNIPAVGFGKTYFANVENDFRPDGKSVTEKWGKINDTTSCFACHDPRNWGLHGGARRDVKLCVLCHQPQTTDPDTGNTVDLKSMVHKIHSPGLLTKPFVIWGNNSSIHDYSGVTVPQDVRNCDNCHEGIDPTKKPAQSDFWYTKPNRVACGSCHEDVNFVTGQNHPGGIQLNDNECATCHQPESELEFDASIKGAHTLPAKSKQLKGINASVLSVTNLGPGKKVTAVFSLKNNDGTFIDGTKLGTFSPIVAGPTSNYSTYYREDARATGVFNATAGTTTYTFTNALPADASGTWTVSADIRRAAVLKRGDGKADITLNESTINPIQYVAVSGPVTARRVVVTLGQCNQCHDALSLHGGQRNTTLECVICHNPTESDVSRRPANAGAPESISFQRLVHRIHTGEELNQNFSVFGFGGSATSFNEVTFPGDRTNCAKCHTANSYKLPLQPGLASVTTLRDFFSPQGPGTSACLGCHDNSDAAAHAYLNSAFFPGSTTPAEACATCHGTGKDWAVEKVHAR